MSRRTSPRPSNLATVALAVAAGLLVAACGGGSGPTPSAPPTDPVVESPTPAEPSDAPAEPSDGAPGEPATALPGTDWNVTRFAGEAGALVGVLPATTITLEFGADGRLGGTSGCNSYGADYTVDEADRKLTVGLASQTLMLCEPPALMVQEAGYVAALQRAEAYDLADGRLTILDGAGATLVEAEQVAGGA